MHGLSADTTTISCSNPLYADEQQFGFGASAIANPTYNGAAPGMAHYSIPTDMGGYHTVGVDQNGQYSDLPGTENVQYSDLPGTVDGSRTGYLDVSPRPESPLQYGVRESKLTCRGEGVSGRARNTQWNTH